MTGLAWTVAVVLGASCLWFALAARRGRQSLAGLRNEIGRLEGRLAEGAADLRDTSARLQSIIDSAVDAIIVIDAHGLIESFNPGAERLFGYTQDDVIGRDVALLMPSPERDEHGGYLRRYLDTGEARIIGIGREVTGLRRDGTTLPLHLSVGEFRHGGERKFTGILHDLTRRVEAERRLREGAALAKVGEMAAVIAHEVKNPLAGVRAALEVLSRRLPDRGDIDVLREIISRIDSLDGLIKDLLLFARPVRLRLAPVDVTTLVAATADLIAHGPDARGVRLEAEGEPVTAIVDAGLLRIAIENLIINATQALNHRGTITTTVRRTPDGCEILVSDNGPGIPDEVRAQVFTPFFTTKARGSGLGLATARRLVEAHGGELDLERRAPRGTTASIRLPTASTTAP